MRIVFMGTSLFAECILRRLHAWGGAELCAVYCRPDMPAKRGQRLMPPPVKMAAEELGMPVFQPADLKAEEDLAVLRALRPDVLAVASYGLILSKAVLDIPSIAPINVHASLLPKYRGAAPIERAVMNGDMQTGVTIMRMEAGLDTGPMYAQRAMGIGLDDTAGDLHVQLAELGADLLIGVLEASSRGEMPVPVPQEGDRSTYAAKLTKDDACTDWTLPARVVHAHLRGVTPAPGCKAVFGLDGRTVAARLTPIRAGRAFFEPFAEGSRPEPGTVLGVVRGGLAIACGDAAVLIGGVCPAGRKLMDALSFANGYLKGVSDARMVS